TRLPARERLAWGRRVAGQLAGRGLAAAQLEVHAGRPYCDALRSAGLVVTSPVEGLPVGRRLAWDRRQAPCPPEAPSPCSPIPTEPLTKDEAHARGLPRRAQRARA